MKRKIIYLIMAGMLTFTGCTRGGAEAPAKTAEAEAKASTTASEDAAQADGEEQTDDPADGEFMPSSFVEIAASKEQFESYDELISYLEKGQGYAYIKLKGYDGDLLAVTEEVYAKNNENHSTSVAIYGEKDGVVKNFGNAFSSEKEYPIAADDGVVYGCYTNNYESLFINTNGDGLMVKDAIMKADDGEYIGFLRETNSLDDADTIDFTGDEKEYKEYWKKYEVATPINFTVVE